jgi:hypothetical protein
MKSTPFALILLLAGALSGGTGVAQTTSPSSGVPFKDGVDVEINGQGPYHFGIDLGSSIAFVITPDLSHQLSLPVTSKTHMHGFEENGANDPEVDVFRIDDLQVAGHVFHHSIGVGYSNASPMLKGGSGTLGIALFQSVVFTLNYPSNRLSISDQSLPSENGKEVFRYTDVHLRPFLDISLGGVTTSACIDTGAMGMGVDLSVPSEFASRLNLHNVEKLSAMVTDIVGHKHELSKATLNGDLTIGNIVVHNPTLLISDAVPYVLLGGILNRTAITLDPRNHRVKLEIQEQHKGTESAPSLSQVNNVP